MNLKKMYKLIALLLMLSIIIPTAPLSSTAKVAQAATAIKLNKKTLSLVEGKTYTLKISDPKAKVTWSTSKKSVATVSSAGKVKAIKAGSAVITATVNKKKYTCKVTVKKAEKKPTATPTPKPTATPTPTPSPTPTPAPVNPNVVNAPFEAQEIKCGDFKAVIPKSWTFKVDSSLGTTAATFLPNGVSNDDFDLSYLTLGIVETGEPAPNYAEIKSYLDSSFNAEIISSDFEDMDVSVTNITKSDVVTKLGTAYKLSYSVTAKVDNEAFTMTQSIYFLYIDNYLILLTISDVGTFINSDFIIGGEYLLNSLEAITKK